MNRACKGLLKSGIIFLSLSLVVYAIYYIDFLEFQKTPNPPFKNMRVSSDPGSTQNSCTFRPLSPEETHEESFLLDSIAWPTTPSVPPPVSLKDTSNAAHSKFVILPRQGGGSWLVGDQLEVMIKMVDFKGRPKNHGGDFLLARLHNRTLEAGVAGQVVDHLNGTYSAVFSLPWEGRSQVEVTLVHPSEAIPFVQRFASEMPDGVEFYSTFQSGSMTETTMCSVCLPPTRQPQCNYTDLSTGELWFCYKPQKLSCDARINHFPKYLRPLKAKEDILFKNGVTLNVGIPASGPAHVTVFPKMKGQPAAVSSNKDVPGPAGYYYKGLWSSLRGSTVKRFNSASEISQCLKDKVVHMYGDSTVRQWLEFLSGELPDLKVYNLYNLRRSGPYVALDYAKNIFVTFHFHGLPFHTAPTPVTELRYVANELDGITGGKNTVVVIGVWAHFDTFPIKYYIRRIMSIRKAVGRLLARAPDTKIIIRTANLKHTQRPFHVYFSDWSSLQRDKILRMMFKGMKVYFVDAWEMTLAHHLKHDLHPPRPIIKNMIDVVLSYICPSK